jgi:hypothetical protein
MLTAVHSPVGGSTSRPSRRRVLRGAAMLPVTGAMAVLGGCTEDAPPAEPDPDRVHLEAARDVESQTLQALIADGPTPDAATDASAVLQSHIDALDAALRTAPSPAASSTDSLSGLPSASPTEPANGAAVQALDAAATSHTRALRTASAAITPLLASIAASDAALAAALRRGDT